MEKEIIKKIIGAIRIQPKDVVLLQLWGENEHLDLLDDFCYEVVKLGATPLKYQHSKKYYQQIFVEASHTDMLYHEDFLKVFEPVTVVIDLMAYRPVIPAEDFPVEKMPAYRTYMGNLFKILGTKEKFVQLRLPTGMMAVEAGIDYESFKTSLLAAYNIDYEELKVMCNQTIEKLSNTSEVEIKTGEDHSLKLSIQDRKWLADSGEGDFPAGEIYIAPVEDSAEGTLFIEETFFDGIGYHDLKLYFEGGKLIKTNNDSFNRMIEEFPANGNVLGELGIGLNKQIGQLIGYTVFDEKAYGTCHIALGMNQMFGGENASPMHEDLVFKADVYFDGLLGVREGKVIVT